MATGTNQISIDDLEKLLGKKSHNLNTIEGIEAYNRYLQSSQEKTNASFLSSKEVRSILKTGIDKIAELKEVVKQNDFQGKDILQTAAGSRSLDKNEIKAWKEYAETVVKLQESIAKKVDERERLRSGGVLTASNEAALNHVISAETKAINDAFEKIKGEFGKGADITNLAQDFKDNDTSYTDYKDNLKKQVKLKKESLELTQEIGKAEAANAAREENIIKNWKNFTSVASQVGAAIGKMASVWMDYNDQAVSDAKRLGLTSQDAVHAYGTAMMKTSIDLARNFGTTREEAAKIQETFQKVTGRAIIMSKEQMMDVQAASSLMGKESVAQAIQIMDTMGSTGDRALELMDRNYARAKNAGLDTSKASEAFVKNMALANQITFKNGVDGVSRMTILSEKLKFNMQSIAAAAEKFSTIEGAIEGSAQLQMLGGSGAMFGGNPMQMMYEAMNDAEAFTERLTKMWGTQASFDRNTGEAKLSGLQLQIVKEQAKAAGVNPEDAVNMAKNQAKFGAFESDNKNLVNRYGVNSREVNTIENKSQYNQESGWTVSWVDKEGNLQTESTNNLTEKQMEEIMQDQLDPMEDIRSHVRQIASELISARQKKNALEDIVETIKAQGMDGVMKGVDDYGKGIMRGDNFGGKILNFLSDNQKLVAGLTGTAAIYKFYGKKLVSKTLESVRTNGGVKNAIKASTKAPVKMATKLGSSPVQTIKALNRLSNIGKVGKMMKWGGRIAAPLAALGAGLEIASATNDDTLTKKEKNSKIGGAVGGLGGSLAGAKLGAIAGTAVGGPVGTLIGGLLGGAVGYFAGDWLGQKTGEGLTSEESSEELAREADESAKKMVSPVEGMSKNVEFIAQHLANGGSTTQLPMFANGGFTKSGGHNEVAGLVHSGEWVASQELVYNPNTRPIIDALDAVQGGIVQGQSLQASKVNTVNSEVINNNSNAGSVNLNVGGEINLKLNGNSIGSLSTPDILKLIKNDPQFQRELADIITGRQASNGNAGRNNYENADNRRGTTNGTYLGGA